MHPSEDTNVTPDPEPKPDRRTISSAALAMTAGLTAGYGMLGYIGFQFLKPQRGARTGWMLVKPLAEFAKGTSVRFRAPDGATINVTRREDTGRAEDFKALSSVCPHLGCQVHWEAQNERYFCPCHNGVFDPDGKGIGGPPGDAGQSLGTYDLKIEQGLLYIQVPLDTLIADAALEELEDDSSTPRGAGHDPCLAPRNPKGRPA